ncbi:MAG: hypothetical protein JW991_05390 [Candidatus Pacebacteria bacterium]|nr:hypothetical protein [Candidatus Paceibacterota bacterium]
MIRIIELFNTDKIRWGWFLDIVPPRNAWGIPFWGKKAEEDGLAVFLAIVLRPEKR